MWRRGTHSARCSRGTPADWEDETLFIVALLQTQHAYFKPKVFSGKNTEEMGLFWTFPCEKC